MEKKIKQKGVSGKGKFNFVFSSQSRIWKSFNWEEESIGYEKKNIRIPLRDVLNERKF